MLVKALRALVVMLVVIALVAAGCGSDDSTGRPGSSSAAFGELLDSAGVEVVAEAAPRGSPAVELTRWQVDNIERQLVEGHGLLGAHLDAVIDAPGGVPVSFLVGAWIDTAGSPNARAAGAMVGEQDWEQAPAVVFPTAVLVLFVLDALEAAPSADAVTGDDEAAAATPGIERIVAAQEPPAGVCSALSAWFNEVLDFIFGLLKIETEDDGLFGFFAAIWNTAVDFARATVELVVDVLTAPLAQLVADVVGVIGTISMIVSTLVPWTVTVDVDTPRTRYAVGAEPPSPHRFTASVDTNVPLEWPDDVEDCARAAGAGLPDPAGAEGAPLTWATKGLPQHGQIGDVDLRLDADNRGRLHWQTASEPDADGSLEVGVVSAEVSIRSAQVEEYQRLIATLITGAVPAGPFEDAITEAFEALAGPVLAELAAFAAVSGANSVRVEYHGADEGDPPTTTEVDEPACPVGRWRTLDFVMPILGDDDAFGGRGAVLELTESGALTVDFSAMTPLVVVNDVGQLGFGATGQASATVEFADGDWRVANLDVGAMGSTQIVNGASFAGPPPGPGTFVGITTTSYTCNNATLVLRAPFEDGVVEVQLTPAAG